MEKPIVDVLMITYNRPSYTRIALEELIARSGSLARIWVWHNGDHEETLSLVRSYSEQFHQFHHSVDNVGLREPTNWLFNNAKGDYLSKVDDDCVVPIDWIPKLRATHEAEPRIGVLGCWRFQTEDYVEELAKNKIVDYSGHKVLRNAWVEGSGYLMKRECFDKQGPLGRDMSFSDYCIELARKGWVNGWSFPFLYQEHMDDPRAENSGIRSDADLARLLPLSAKRNGVRTVEQWTAQLKRSAVIAQQAPYHPAYWSPTRRKLRNLKKRARGLFMREKGLW